MIKEKMPELQLVMVAGMANDDPEGWSYFERAARRAGVDDDIHLLLNVGNVGVNAIQRNARVMIQKSIREGFGLTVSEALWKGRPVVAGNAGGIPLQMLYGKNGYLVNTTAECADRIKYLLDHPQISDKMGLVGKEHVRENFLTTRYLRDYLRLFNRVKD
jgi:trehalose synthase